MPPQPTKTRTSKSFTLLLPAGLVTFTFPAGDISRTRISIPAGSPWSPGAHWHEHYVEHVRVIKGRVKFTIGGVVSVKGVEDEEVTFEKFVVHDFCRAEGEEEVIVEEWTDPEDGFKEVFFYNVMSAFSDPLLGGTTASKPPSFTVPLLLQLLTTIPYVDNYVDPLPFLPTRELGSLLGRILFGVRWMVTHSVYTLGGTVGWMAGYQKWVKEYTPEEYWKVAERGPLPKGTKVE